MRRLLLAVLFVALPLSAAETLDNAAVIKLVRAGIGPDVIMAKIERSKTNFDTSTDALVVLKAAGVPDGLIKAMIVAAPAAPQAVQTVPAPASPMPNPVPPPMPVQQATLAPPERYCISTTFYTTGNNGFGWYPAGLCASADSLSVDEQVIPLASVTAQCLTKPLSLGFGGSLLKGDPEYWFSDGKEVFKFRGKAEELTNLSDYVTRAKPGIVHGGCADRDVRLRMNAK